MVRKTLLLIASLTILQFTAAQIYTFSPNRFGANLFFGGMDTPRFQFVDIDGDDDNDLFIIDRDERLQFFRNVNGTLTIEPNSTFGLTAGSWFRFADIDSDGDQDCLTNGSSSEVSLYTNTGTSVSPQFQLTVPVLRDTSGIDLFSERFSIPTLADPDGDGDLDLFTGGSIGSITYYQNIGTKFSPKYTYITSEYQGINIQGGPVGLPKALHGASGIEFFDADSNGVLDLFWGDYFNPSLYFLKNIGTKLNPNIILSDSTYPNESVIHSYGFNVPQHVDVDANGIVDLMVGCVFPNVDKDNFMFYQNIGTNADPFYQLKSKNYIPMIDVGSRSSVASADFDRDGDIDLCVTSSGGKVSLFQNIGTKTKPFFSAEPVSVFSLNGEFNITVTAGYVNSDTLPDLLLGTFENGLKVYLNTTTDGVITFAHQEHLLESFSLGQNTSPSLADVDNDGKFDVLVGNSGGQIALLRNTTVNGIQSYQIEKNFNSIDVGNDAAPFCSDIDKDGVLELLIGNIDGVIWYYKQVAGIANKFSLVNQKYDGIDVRLQASPDAADLDGDGDADLLIGNGKGGVYYFENTASPSGVSAKPVQPTGFVVERNYPNPFNPSTTISYSVPVAAAVRIVIFDLLGRELEVLTDGPVTAGRHSLIWNASQFPTGTYLYRCTFITSGATTNTVNSMLLIK